MQIEYQKLNGEVLNTETLLPTQEAFYKSKIKFILFSGGFGCGKTRILCHKVLQHLDYPNNYGLLGRLTYQELKDTTQQTFFEICPPSLIRSYSRSEQRLYLKNSSQLIFRHLDAVSEAEIKSLNLGFFAIDQIEEIDESIFLALRGRLRRVIPKRNGRNEKYVHQGMMTCNPALFWAFKLFKQQQDPDYQVFEAPSIENKENLPVEYLKDLMKYPEAWKRRFVYGTWDESIEAERAFFPIEYYQEQDAQKEQSIRDFEGITIFKEKNSMDSYQMGCDPSEGIDDPSAIVVISQSNGKVVATWSGKMSADQFARIISKVGRIYRDANVVLEVNSMGMATLAKLRELAYPSIYKRETFDSIQKKRVTKFGWKTTYANKYLLLENMLTLLRENKIKLNDPRIIEQMKTFAYSEDSHKYGLGALPGFHDDFIIATALACWGIKGGMQSFETLEVPRNSFIGTFLRMQKKTGFIGQNR